MQKSKVAVIKTKPETVQQDIVTACEMAGIEEALAAEKTTILKDNISWHLPMPAANSTPWQLEGVIRALRKHHFSEIVAVENKTVVTRPKHGEKLNKYDRIYEKYNIPVKFNFVAQDMKWVGYEPKAELNVLHKIYKNGIYIPDYFFDKNIIHLPTVKCHIYTTTTGAMKNAFGGLLATHRHYTHSWIHETLVDLLKIQQEIHSGVFAVMDGTTLGNGPGPRTLKPVLGNLILASADQVAIDAVAAKIMGFNPMTDLKYVRMASEQGLGTGRIEEIEIAGEDLAQFQYKFKVGDNLASRFGDLLWFGSLKWAQKFFFHTPMVNVFVVASDLYHDKIWWNLKGKRVFKDWQQNSPWGQLFARY
ncbi:MAG TPA: DUF362 domain-containing protein [Bacteroidetes bacterium]|nr:DUF362 domain-containing protein [Bacteroidota bacterium]